MSYSELSLIAADEVSDSALIVHFLELMIQLVMHSTMVVFVRPNGKVNNLSDSGNTQ